VADPGATDDAADPAADTSDDASDDESSDEPFTDAQLAELCGSLANGGGTVDPGPVADESDPAFADIDPGDMGTPGQADGTDPADSADEADAPDPGDDTGGDAGTLDELCSAVDLPGEAADGGSLDVSLKRVLAGGVVNTGSVTLTGAGTVTQELWLPGRPGASAARKSAKPRKAGSARLLAGSVKRTVSKAGNVRLSVHLNRAARKRLRAARKDVRISVKTVTRLKGGKARTKVGTVVLRKAAR
jgi:hypothetical protein